MRTAFNDFFYEKRGIYGVLHVMILLLSLFLIVDISIDTFNNIPFISQTSYLKTQFWICMFFIADFILEFFLSKDKIHYLQTHFLFLLVSIPYLNIINYYDFTFSAEVTYFLRFIPLVRSGWALAIVVGWLTSNRASGLFVSYLTMLLAMVYFSSLIFFVIEQKVNPEGLQRRPLVGFHGRDDCRFEHHRDHAYRAYFVGPAGRSRHDDVPDLHGLCHEPSTIGKQEKRKLL